jgi:hypothetical protein
VNSIFSHNIFSSNYKVFHANRVYDNVTQGGRMLIAISQTVSGMKHRFYLELIN